MDAILHDLAMIAVGFAGCAVVCFGWYHGHLKQQFNDVKDHITASAGGEIVTLEDKAKAIVAKATADIAALAK